MFLKSIIFIPFIELNIGENMFYSTIMKIDSIDRLRDIRDALLVEQGINPTRNGEQAIRVVVDRIDEIQSTLDKRAPTI